MTLTSLAKLAWRNLWRNYRRTLIMLAAIVVGVWAMIFMTALMRGMVDQMVDNGLKTFVGHMQIHHETFLDDPAIENTMNLPDDTLRAALEHAQAWTMRVRAPAVINSERESRGITLMGIVPAREAPMSFLASSIIEGRYLQDENDRGLIIGHALAEKLDTRLGKRIVITSQDPHNNIVDIGMRIVGVYKASLSATEEQFVFVGIKKAQAFLGVEGQISEIEILGEDFRDLAPLKNSIAKATKKHEQLLLWSELQSYLASMLSVMDGFVLIWMLVVFIALSFGLVNTFIMAVFERTREIGLLLALGMAPRLILWQILLEAVFLLALGLLIGTALAWFGIQPLESGIDVSVVAEGMAMMGMGAVLYPSLTVGDMVTANIIVIALGILASLLPALKASRLKPVEAMSVS